MQTYVVGWNATWREAVNALIGSDHGDPAYSVLQIVCRSIIIYLAGMTVVRLGKSRMVGRVTSLDILLGFILGSLLSRGITGHASLIGTIVASATLAAVHWLLTWGACRWRWLGQLFKGHAIILVRNGQPIPENLLHSHISEHDLEEELRLQGVADLHDVRLAAKERNGQISVIKSRP